MLAKIVWFTGLSGAGKTTIANRVTKLLSSQGERVLVLDGDDVRKKLHVSLGFTPEDIRENNQLIVQLCQKHRKDYDFIMVPIISPFSDSRKNARKLLEPGFFEIYIYTSIKKVIQRDTKGLYQKAIQGKLQNVIGISDQVPYEPPENPDLILDAENKDIDHCVELLHGFLKNEYVRE